MARAKKSSKKSKFNPANFERFLMMALLALFVVSAVALLVRSSGGNGKIELGEPSAPIEKAAE